MTAWRAVVTTRTERTVYQNSSEGITILFGPGNLKPPEISFLEKKGIAKLMIGVISLSVETELMWVGLLAATIFALHCKGR